MSMSQGKALADAVGDIFGIDSRWIFGCDADATRITIWRGVEASDGGPAVMLNSDGTITEACQVAEEFIL